MNKSDEQAAEEYALNVEWIGQSYEARKRYYHEAFLAGCAHKEKQLKEEQARLLEVIKRIEFWVDSFPGQTKK